MTDTERTCNKCGETKVMDLFPKEPKSKFGRRPECKKCRNILYREVKYPRAKVRPLYKENHRRNAQNYTKAHPEKVRAHQLAKTVPLKPACEDCGVAAERLHRHHPDYAKPLEVVTLCVTCHEKAHHGALV